MSFLDKVTKAVGDAVDRGKKEVDQFVRIQKINSQIGDIERRIGECRGQIQQHKLKAGEIALEMMRAGSLSSQEMKALLDQIDGIEQQIRGEETAIAEKKAEIESIKAEKTQVSSAEQQPFPTPPPAATAQTGRLCPQCGAQLSGGGAFCTQCGAKQA